MIPPEPHGAGWAVVGDPTEAALKVLSLKGGVDLATEAARLPRVRELPFDSVRKRMSTIHQEGDGRIAFVKGAPREVVALSSRILISGVAEPLSLDRKRQILAANDHYARSGLRVLAVAERPLGADVQDYSPETVEKELTLLGLVAMLDPPRPEVARAIEKCHVAGIRVIMITGDYGLTAESIARRIGIVRGGAEAAAGHRRRCRCHG